MFRKKLGGGSQRRESTRLPFFTHLVDDAWSENGQTMTFGQVKHLALVSSHLKLFPNDIINSKLCNPKHHSHNFSNNIHRYITKSLLYDASLLRAHNRNVNILSFIQTICKRMNKKPILVCASCELGSESYGRYLISFRGLV